MFRPVSEKPEGQVDGSVDVNNVRRTVAQCGLTAQTRAQASLMSVMRMGAILASSIDFCPNHDAFDQPARKLLLQDGLGWRW